MLANEKLSDFRATVAELNFDDRGKELLLPQEIADALHLQAGDTVTASAL
ncbi:MAG: arginine N-succinyltransferase [Pseudoalteromonas sp.]